jgi:hypothetical protein
LEIRETLIGVMGYDGWEVRWGGRYDWDDEGVKRLKGLNELKV